ITLGSAYPGEGDERMQVKGRDLGEGVPKVVVVAEREIREALRDVVITIVETVRACLEQAPPELAADIVDTGIVITGGGGLLRGLDRLVERETQLPVAIAKDPMSCVALGLGRILDELDLLQKCRPPPCPAETAGSGGCISFRSAGWRSSWLVAWIVFLIGVALTAYVR